jgi:hypothetical protein
MSTHHSGGAFQAGGPAFAAPRYNRYRVYPRVPPENLHLFRKDDGKVVV